MGTRLKTNLKVGAEWIARARKRVFIPDNWLEVDYQKNVDVLYIKLSNNPAVSSDDDLDKSLVFDYDENGQLVGIEVLNLYGIFATV